jgi:hypothetical protein
MKTWIVQRYLSPGPGKGNWYECRRFDAETYGEAFKIAFPGMTKAPSGYRVVLA